jgi:hypothetical protein
MIQASGDTDSSGAAPVAPADPTPRPAPPRPPSGHGSRVMIAANDAPVPPHSQGDQPAGHGPAAAASQHEGTPAPAGATGAKGVVNAPTGPHLAAFPDPGHAPTGDATQGGDQTTLGMAAGGEGVTEDLADLAPAAGGVGVPNTGAAFTPYSPMPLPPGIDHLTQLDPTSLSFGAPEPFGLVLPLQLEALAPLSAPQPLPPVVGAEGGGQSILVQNVIGEHDPQSQPWPGDYLRGHESANNSSLVNGLDGANLTLHGDAHVAVQFESEAAGYRSMLGWYKVVDGAPVDPQLIWLDTSQSSQNVDGNPLVNGQPMTVDLGVLPEGTEIGFFLIANGWSSGPNLALLSGKTLDQINAGLGIADGPDGAGNLAITFGGQPLAGSVYYTSDPTLNPDDLQHALSGIDAPHAGWLHIAFEDLLNGGDHDYNDVLFRVQLGDYSYRVMSGDSFHGDVTITDPDSTMLISAQALAHGLGSGDTLSFDTGFAAGHGVTATPILDGAQVVGYDFAGTASLDDYATLLSSVTIHVDSSDPLPGSRSLDYQVTDDTGLSSNLAGTTFDVASDFLGTSHGDVLSGGNGPESFFGMGGDDTISGAGGDDRLLGGDGNDSLAGGGGADTFQFSLHGSAVPGPNDGADRVADFDRTSDVLKFTDVANVNGGGLDLSDLQAQTHVTDDGTNVTVTFDNGASIVFEGMGTAGHTITDISQLVDSAAAQIQVSG